MINKKIRERHRGNKIFWLHGMAASLTLFAWLALVSTGSAAKLPSIDLNKPGWKLTKGASIDNGILTIHGASKQYRKATLLIPISELGTEHFFICAKMKTENMQRGKRGFEIPKIKIYYQGADDTRKTSRLAMESTPGWITLSLAYRANMGLNCKNLVLELVMEGCTGTTQFKDLRLSRTPPPVEQKFPYAIPENASCRLHINTTRKRAFNNHLLGLNSHFVGINRRLSYADERIQKLIKNIRVPLLRFPGGTVSHWYGLQDRHVGNYSKHQPQNETAVSYKKRHCRGAALPF